MSETSGGMFSGSTTLSSFPGGGVFTTGSSGNQSSRPSPSVSATVGSDFRYSIPSGTPSSSVSTSLGSDVTWYSSHSPSSGSTRIQTYHPVVSSPSGTPSPSTSEVVARQYPSYAE